MKVISFLALAVVSVSCGVSNTQSNTNSVPSYYQEDVTNFNKSATIKTDDPRWKCRNSFTSSGKHCYIDTEYTNISYSTELVSVVRHKSLDMAVNRGEAFNNSVNIIIRNGSKKAKLLSRAIPTTKLSKIVAQFAGKELHCLKLNFSNGNFECTELVEKKVRQGNIYRTEYNEGNVITFSLKN